MKTRTIMTTQKGLYIFLGLRARLLTMQIVGVIIFQLLGFNSTSQSCYPNGIQFSSQAEVDLFPVVNPGCKVIGGNFTISGSDITNLDSLYSIEVIQGNFRILSNSLTSFEGLNNLDTIGAELNISANNPSLTNFEGLESLKKIGSFYDFHTISGNSFVDFTGLDSLQSIDGFLNINYCDNLSSLAGLTSLTSIYDLHIEDCFSLSSLQGLSNPVSVPFINLKDLPVLTSMDGFEYFENVSSLQLEDLSALNNLDSLVHLSSLSTLQIDNCDELYSLDGLEGLNDLDGYLYMWNNNSLEDISALANVDLSNTNSIYITGNPQLAICNVNSICEYLSNGGSFYLNNNDVGCSGVIEVSGACCMSDPIWCPEPMESCYPNGIQFSSQAEVDLFPVVNPGCKVIGGNFTITGSDITNLDSLYSIEVIQGNFRILSNSLTSFEGLNNLDTIGAELNISANNPSLTNFEGLESLKKIGSFYDFHTISGNSFVDFTGLDSLQSIDGFLNINYCDNLSSLAGLTSLTSIYDLHIEDCFSLSSLQGLSNPVSVPFINLKDLPVLTSMDGFEYFENVSSLQLEDLSALNNLDSLVHLSSLSTLQIDNCDELYSLDGLEGLNDLDGYLYMWNNNSLEDISALANVDLSNTNSIYITGNPQLAICNVSSICEYLSNGGSFYLNNNDVGCSGVIEVSGACCMSDPIWCPEPMESCYPNGIQFSSQAEVDLFPVVNPGCKVIGGNFTISGSDITNLDSLYSIEVIQGNFRILSNSLTSFEGLNNLDTIGAELNISANNPSLTNFEGLESLKKIGSFYDFHTISGNSFVDFTGLDSLQSIDGFLNINYCDNLSSLAGLTSLTSIYDLHIEDCFSLSSLQGLSNPVSVPFINLKDLPVLTSMDGIEYFENVSSLQLEDLSALNNLDSLVHLSSLSTLQIDNCDELYSLDGLEGLNDLDGYLYMWNNNSLEDISALANVDLSNTNSIYITGNPKLSVCNIDAICDYLDLGGSININNNGVGCNGVIEVEYDCDGLLSIFVDNGTNFSGSTNNYWHNPDNWQNNEIPSENSFVIIPKDYDCLIQADSIAHCKILEIQQGTVITCGANSQLNVIED